MELLLLLIIEILIINNSAGAVFAYFMDLEAIEVSADEKIPASSTWICVFRPLIMGSDGPEQYAYRIIGKIFVSE